MACLSLYSFPCANLCFSFAGCSLLSLQLSNSLESKIRDSGFKSCHEKSHTAFGDLISWAHAALFPLHPDTELRSVLLSNRTAGSPQRI